MRPMPIEFPHTPGAPRAPLLLGQRTRMLDCRLFALHPTNPTRVCRCSEADGFASCARLQCSVQPDGLLLLLS